jgi:hypothetical protein
MKGFLKVIVSALEDAPFQQVLRIQSKYLQQLKQLGKDRFRNTTPNLYSISKPTKMRCLWPLCHFLIWKCEEWQAYESFPNFLSNKQRQL